jgi:hypothetical protein
LNTQNISTLKIHKLTQAQYDRELQAGRIDENALYLTPDEKIDLSGFVTKEYISDVSYSKDEIDAMIGSYINDIDTLIGGDA